MDVKRSQTHEALERYINSQKALLERTRSDIQLLQRLQETASQDKEGEDDTCCDTLDDLDVNLSEYEDDAILRALDWSAFEGCDPTPLNSFASTLREGYQRLKAPSKVQQSEPSYYQKFVKDAKADILDAIYAKLGPLPSVDPSVRADDIDPLLVRRQKQKAASGLGLTVTRSRANQVVANTHAPCIDAPADVDMALADDSATLVCPTPTSKTDTSSTRHSTPLTVIETGSSRIRRPSVKLQDSLDNPVDTTSAKWNNPRPTRKRKVSDMESDSVSLVPSKQEAGKPKSDTYKQAWSDSEQNLLERLLEEIPSKEKNRWQKISHAMNGRRSPKQVASRVQKYFEKLKRFGIQT